jgi:hypothetical protein
MRIFYALLLVSILAALSGCGSIYDPEPVAIGPDPSELKRSPCACLELKLEKTLPEWFVSEQAV